MLREPETLSSFQHSQLDCQSLCMQVINTNKGTYKVSMFLDDDDVVLCVYAYTQCARKQK